MEDEADNQAMMEAMGFSSFGMQKPANKKRKYNPQADAAIETAYAPKYSSSGANSTPLGDPAQRQATAQISTNTDEISLEDDDDDGDELHGNVGATIEGRGIDLSSLPGQVPAGLPARPAQSAGFGGQGQRGHHGGQHGHAGDRTSGHVWYEGYYDHYSNENPWEELEKRMGLKPLGAWPAQQHPTAQPAGTS